MNICTLRCDGCDVELSVARHDDTCDDPQAHGALKVASDGHLAYHADCCTLAVTTETVEAYEYRLADEAIERRAALQFAHDAALRRLQHDRQRASVLNRQGGV